MRRLSHFDDGEFDVVTSCLGAMFAPDQRKVADELLRVCRASGTIGMINFTPQGKGGEFFRVVAPYMPPPPAGVAPPVLWGDEEHVRRLFGALVDRLVMTKREYIEAAESPSAYLSLFKRTFGPLVAVYASLADQPERAAALDRAFLDFARRSTRGAPGARVEIPYEYLLIVARKHV